MNKKYIFNFFLILVCSFFLKGCKPENAKVNRAFYYWKSNFELNENELTILKKNNISTLYIKYFDVVWNAQLNSAVPVAKILFKQFDYFFTSRDCIIISSVASLLPSVLKFENIILPS